MPGITFYIYPMKIAKNINIIFLVLLLIIAILAVVSINKEYLTKNFDDSDAPTSYGRAVHINAQLGPYFGLTRGNGNNAQYKNQIFFADINLPTQNRDDAFDYLDFKDSSTIFTPKFAPEINAAVNIYNLLIPVNDAENGDPVIGWIDFNGNGKFDSFEKATTTYKNNNWATLTWALPDNLTNAITYLRIRTTTLAHKLDIEYPNGNTHFGEVEDYAIKIYRSSNPTSEIRDIIDLAALNGVNGIDATTKVIAHLPLGEKNLAIKLKGVVPNNMGINNLHDASFTGIRLAHEANNTITNKKPQYITFKTSIAVENFSFEMIDIDDGDRIKIEAYHNLEPVSFEVYNLSDNYYCQFNSNTKEIYGDVFVNAGITPFIQSSLFMGVKVMFNNFIDSVKLTYVDDALTTNGSITLGNFSCRKFNNGKVLVTNLTVQENENYNLLSWKITKNEFLKNYTIERSYDGVSYEAIYKGLKMQNETYQFKDEDLALSVPSLYYRIKLTEHDFHSYCSEPIRFKKNFTKSISGYRAVNSAFSDSIKLILMQTIPGECKINLYDYDAKLIKQWRYSNLKINDTLTLQNLNALPKKRYMLQMINNNNKYLIELYKK